MAELSPHLLSVDALFLHLGVGKGERDFLLKHAGYRYRPANIPKRRGGTRALLVPEDRLKYLQQKLLALLEDLYVPRAPVHGFVKKRSAITNAEAHQRRPFLLNIDLENYFSTINANRVRGVLQSLGITHDVASAITRMTVVNNQLPQGAPTSPILANMVSFRLDRELMSFAAAHRLRYTRYADDISFSSYVEPAGLFTTIPTLGGRLTPDDLSTELRHIVEGNGFWINSAKIWYASRVERKEVTGLIVNAFTNVPRKYVRNLRAALYRTRQLGVAAAAEEFQAKVGPKASLEQALRGRLDWLAQVRGRSFPPYRTYAGMFNSLFPSKPMVIDPTHEEIAREAVWVIEFYRDGKTEDSSQGTAFFLENVGLVTAHHVLKGMTSGWADLFRPHRPTQKFRARFGLLNSPHRDLAVLEHDVPEAQQITLKAAAGPAQGRDSILALGYPAFSPADDLGMRPGSIVGRTRRSAVRMIEVSAVLSDGLSGGPIVNTRYEVIGVIHKGGGDETKQLSIDIAELFALLEENGKTIT